MHKLGLKKNEIKLVPYTEEYHCEFCTVKDEILRTVPIEENRIEHIGSTAIKGIVSKPVLDLVMGIDRLQSINPEIVAGLKKSGFLRLKVERPEEIIFAKFTDDTYQEKTHFLHLVEYNQQLWHDLVFFRDHLNANPGEREAYQRLKKDSIRLTGIDEYTASKESFVKRIYSKRK
ncbi:GrpB family protein [Peribacillus psychrosaccharolyticus]|uniref:GrpB family protein n=1 Tax=Peribacillus psychrosaccharolyticus TaxID=1407 RepID=UPI003D2E38C1